MSTTIALVNFLNIASALADVNERSAKLTTDCRIGLVPFPWTNALVLELTGTQTIDAKFSW